MLFFIEPLTVKKYHILNYVNSYTTFTCLLSIVLIALIIIIHLASKSVTIKTEEKEEVKLHVISIKKKYPGRYFNLVHNNYINTINNVMPNKLFIWDKNYISGTTLG